jgi:hypothetical protein
VRVLLLPLGVLVLGVMIVDVLMTTLAVGAAAGPVTARVARSLWRVAMALRRRRSLRVLSTAGVVIVVTVVLVWALLAYVGWVLIFSAAPEAIVETSTGLTPDFWDRVCYVGYSLTTLGIGDYRPNGGAWQLATVGMAANGLFVATLSVTYLVPVAAAVTQKRQVAAYISSLGSTPQRLLLTGWDGKDFDVLTRHLDGIAPMLHLLEQRHLTYPVLHFFYSVDPRTSAPLRVAALDEALTLLSVAVQPRLRPSQGTLAPLRQSIAEFLRTLETGFVSASDEAPPPPSLDALRAAGVGLVPEEDFETDVKGLDYRRRLLRGLVRHSGWEWDEVEEPDDEADL